MKKTFNPLALLGILGLFGFLGPITGISTWYWWFGWFLWFGNYNKPTDERFYRNLSKAGLPCFGIAMLGITILDFLKELGLSKDIIYSGIELVFVVPFLSFMILHRYFEVYGD